MIILASAKTMKESETINSSVPIFEDKSKKIREQIAKLSKEELATYFKIKGKTLDNTELYYSNPPQGKVVTSLDGAVFKQINCLDDKYIAKNLFVLDAMYGILNGNDKIDLFRLDFNTKSLLETSYYNYWKDDVYNFIENTNHKQLLILTSDEYTKLLKLDQLNKLIFTIEFDTAIKSTVFKKQCRGLIANYCIEHNIADYHQLDDVIIEDYRLQLQANNILYITNN